VIYRKWGRVVRWENGTIVRVEEAGEAREENGIFLAQPIAEREALPELGSWAMETVRAIGKAERLLVTDGVALHECDGVRWQEQTRRVHVALTRRPWRVLVDDAEVVARVAGALARCEGEKDFERVLLLPHVAKHLIEGGRCPPLPVGAHLEQLPGGRDGYGRPVEHRRVEGEPPNVYRPSYRVRPVPRWLNVRAIPFGTIGDAPEAIALLDAAVPTVLVDDGGRVFVTRLRVDRVIAAGEAGEMLL
jgi:hypothetical protein